MDLSNPWTSKATVPLEVHAFNQLMCIPSACASPQSVLHALLQMAAEAFTDKAWDLLQKAPRYQHQSQFCWIGRRHRTLETSEYCPQKNKYEPLNIQPSFIGLQTDTILEFLSQDGTRGLEQANPWKMSKILPEFLFRVNGEGLFSSEAYQWRWEEVIASSNVKTAT